MSKPAWSYLAFVFWASENAEKPPNRWLAETFGRLATTCDLQASGCLNWSAGFAGKEVYSGVETQHDNAVSPNSAGFATNPWKSCVSELDWHRKQPVLEGSCIALPLLWL